MATPMAMPVPGIQAERDHALDWVKWLALVAMVLDHLWFVLPAEWQDPGYGLRVAGRLAFPLFCLAIAANVARQPAGFPVGIGRYLGFQAGTPDFSGKLAKPVLVRVVAKQLFYGTGTPLAEIPGLHSQNMRDKPCRIVSAAGNFACDLFRQNFRGFRLTTPIH